jgi:preprotein translocase subunit SecG
MEIFITILIVITSVLLIGIVLIQNSKGGGLASNFSSSNQIMGVRKTADFLEKSTWTLAGALLVLCLLSSAFMSKDNSNSAPKTELEDMVNKNAVTPPAGFENQPASSDPLSLPQQEEE